MKYSKGKYEIYSDESTIVVDITGRELGESSLLSTDTLEIRMVIFRSSSNVDNDIYSIDTTTHNQWQLVVCATEMCHMSRI